MNSKARLATVSCSVLLLSVSFISCGEQKTPFDEQFKDNVTANSNSNVNSVEFKGMVKSVAVADVSGARMYVITTEDKKEIALESSLVALERYVDKMAIVRGYFKDAEQKVLSVLDAIEVESESNTNTDTRQMKNYTSEAMGVEFVYPFTWQVSDPSTAKVQAVSEQNQEKVFDITRTKHGVSDTIDAFLKKNYSGKEITDVQIGSVLGKSVATASSDEQLLLVDLNGNYYTIHYFYKGKELDKTMTSRDFSELLNSMRFFKPGTKSVNENTNEMSTNKNINTASANASEDSTTVTSDIVKLKNENSNVVVVKNSGTNTVANTNTNKAIPKEVAATTTTASTAKPVTEDTGLATQVLSYIKTTPALLPTTSGTPKVLQMELAGKSYVYVTYSDGDKKMKVLYSYGKDAANALTFKQEGLFEQGDKTTWTKVSGQNMAASAPREVYDVKDGSTVEKKASVTKGMTLYTNKNNSYSIQYPRDWYYQTKGSTGGAMEEVTFSSKPHDETTDTDKTVVLRVYKGGSLDLKGAEQTTIAGKEGYVVKDKEGNTLYAVKGSDGKVYAAKVPEGARTGDAMVQILGSVQ